MGLASAWAKIQDKRISIRIKDNWNQEIRTTVYTRYLCMKIEFNRNSNNVHVGWMRVNAFIVLPPFCTSVPRS